MTNQDDKEISKIPNEGTDASSNQQKFFFQLKGN